MSCFKALRQLLRIRSDHAALTHLDILAAHWALPRVADSALDATSTKGATTEDEAHRLYQGATAQVANFLISLALALCGSLARKPRVPLLLIFLVARGGGRTLAHVWYRGQCRLRILVVVVDVANATVLSSAVPRQQLRSVAFAPSTETACNTGQVRQPLIPHAALAPPAEALPMIFQHRKQLLAHVVLQPSSMLRPREFKVSRVGEMTPHLPPD
mmetsp:Transcript_46397/g.101033  ORF Transcript_46397/g.101033 Transcript_46397/m.101033 type:complete len:215 (-) Transcript_46397:1319-1963(-)